MHEIKTQQVHVQCPGMKKIRYLSNLHYINYHNIILICLLMNDNIHNLRKQERYGAPAGGEFIRGQSFCSASWDG